MFIFYISDLTSPCLKKLKCYQATVLANPETSLKNDVLQQGQIMDMLASFSIEEEKS